MLLFRNWHVAVLLLLTTQSLVLASSDLENARTEVLANSKMIAISLQDSWIDRINAVVRSSESSCADEIAALAQAVQSGQLWALRMLDASSKIQSGILNGNTRDLGMYDQCVGVNEVYNDTKVQGKHCTVSFSLISSSVCMPASCNETQVLEIISDVIQNVTENSESELEISRVSCVQVGSEDFTIGEIITIVFFATVGAFIVSCTICDLVKRSKSGDVSATMENLSKFSLYTNAIALMSTKISPKMMPAIQGLRFFSICWVILGHRYLNSLSTPMVNFAEVPNWFNSWSGVYIQAAPFAVETFFVVSGFLMTYLFLGAERSGKKSNYLMMYLHRYLRLTPCIAVLMLFVAVLLHRVDNGPLWQSLHTGFIKPCQKNWWVNLLYVQNLVRPTNLCLTHSWYLAVDMQLFWISPIILYPLHRWPKYGLGILCMFLVASVATPPITLAINSYSNAVFRFDVTSDEVQIPFLYFYIPTYNRACAYFVGILMGFDVANGKRRFTKTTVAIFWVTACIFLLICGLATHRIYSSNFEYNLVLETMFALFLRPLWSLAIAWIIYACTQGYGGAVTSLLSLPIFLPLGRLSYCIYLVHMVIQAAKVAAIQTPGRFTEFLVLEYFWADLIVSIAVAFIFSLFFESPIVVLEKMLTTRGRKRKPPTPAHMTTKDLEGGIDNRGMVET